MARSSNGRTPDSDSGNGDSTPLRAILERRVSLLSHDTARVGCRPTPSLELPLQIKIIGPREALTSEGLDQGDVVSLNDSKVARRSVAAEISGLLDSPEIAELTAELDGLRWTGRKGYGSRALIGACLVKSLYAIPTWSRTAALIGEHEAIQERRRDPRQHRCLLPTD